MTLEQLYHCLGSYVRNGYGFLNVGVENAFGEGGDLNAVVLSSDGKSIIFKESFEPQFFEGGLYDVDLKGPFIARRATGDEGPGTKAGDHILERDDGDKMMHVINGIPENARFTGIVAHFSILKEKEECNDQEAD